MQVKNLVKERIIYEGKEFPSAHASTLIQTEDGTIIAAWFAGTKEKAPDVSIWTSRRVNGVWEKPKMTSDFENIAMWNPVLFQKSNGSVILFFKVGKEIPEWQTWYVESFDNGISYTEPKELVPGDIGGRGPVKNKPIRLNDGTVLAPASLEGEFFDAFIDISKDDCTTWEMSEMVPLQTKDYKNIHKPYNKYDIYGQGVIQPTLWQDDTGDVHMFLRSTSSRIFRSDSKDGGKTWCMAYDTGLPNNNSGIDLVRMASGDIVLVYNPRENLPNFRKGPRTPLSVAVSKDNGETFTHLLDLETEAGNFSYPAIITNEKNEVLITYTWNRETIAFAQFMYE